MRQAANPRNFDDLFVTSAALPSDVCACGGKGVKGLAQGVVSVSV